MNRRGFLGLVFGGGAAVIGGAACVLASDHRDASGEEESVMCGFGHDTADFDTRDFTYVKIERYVYQTDIGCGMAYPCPPVA